MNEAATSSLDELHDDYVEQVNLAVSEDRDDIVDALTTEFTAARLQLLRDRASRAQSEAASPSRRASPPPAPAVAHAWAATGPVTVKVSTMVVRSGTASRRATTFSPPIATAM